MKDLSSIATSGYYISSSIPSLVRLSRLDENGVTSPVSIEDDPSVDFSSTISTSESPPRSKSFDDCTLFSRGSPISIEPRCRRKSFNGGISKFWERCDFRKPPVSEVALSKAVPQFPGVNYPQGANEQFYNQLNQLSGEVNTFFGIGLGTPKGLSKGLPIDLLNMIFMAERIGYNKHIVIADETAKNNIKHNPESYSHENVEKYVSKIIGTLGKVLYNLGMSGWHFHRESEVAKKPEVAEIMQDTVLPEELEASVKEAHRDPLYFRQQFAHSAYFEVEKSCSVKIGWCYGNEKGVNEQFSEAGFDKNYAASFSPGSAGDLDFVYTTAGRSFDPRASRSAPYVTLDDSKRLILLDGDKNRAKLESFDDMRAKSKARSKPVYDRFEEQIKTIVESYNALILNNRLPGTEIDSGDWKQDILTLLDRCENGREGRVRGQ